MTAKKAAKSRKPAKAKAPASKVVRSGDAAEHKRAEEALRAREAQLAAIHDNVCDVIFALRVEPNDCFRFTMVNRRFADVTGVPADQVVGKLVQEVIPEPAHALVLGKYREAIRDRRPVHWEEVSVYPAGTRLGEVTVTPVLDAKGHCTQLIGVVHDITDRKRVEGELRKSIERSEAVQRIGRVGYLDWDLATDDIVLSKEAAEIFHFDTPPTPDGVMGRVHPDDRECVERSTNAAVAGIATFDLEHRILWPDGTEIWVSATAEMSRSEDGTPARMLGTIQDITERKREAEYLRRMATVVQDSNDAITIQDFDGRITAWNRGAELMYGHREAEALLMNIERLTTPEKVVEQREFIRRLIAGEAITSFETQRVTKDGRVLDVWMTVTKLLDDAGNPIGLASTERDITERKREAEHLRRMATVVRDSNDAITIQDFDGRITAWNRGAELMYGYGEEEAMALNIERLTTPSKVEEQKDFIRRLIAGEAITSFETQRVTKDGRVLDVWMTVTKLTDDAGTPVGLASTERDITARKRAEDALKQSEEKLRAILDATPFPVAVVDLQDDNIQLWSRSALALFGHTAPTASEWYQIAYPDPGYRRDVIQRWTPFLETARASRETVINTGLYRVTCRDGSERVCELHVGFLPDSFIVTFNDVTERKREEQNVRRMATVVRDSNDAITIQDFDGRITAWNRGAELMYGHREAEALLMNIERLTTPEKVVEQREFIRRLIAGEAITSFETQRVTKDGRVLDVWMTVTKLMDDTGNPIGLASTERDITERVHAAEEKTRLEDQLRQSQKLEAIGQLAGGVAHDFNNMMAVVLGYGEMLLGQLVPDDPRRKSVEQIVEAGRRSAALTKQLLAFSRKQTLQPVVLDLDALLGNLGKMLGRLIGEDIVLEFRLGADSGRVTADPGQIEQVVMNLAVNAHDAMLQGGRLTIQTANVELDETYLMGNAKVIPGRYVMLAVTDTGCGMDQATLARIYEPFFTTKETGKGTGLGLSTVYGIVKQSGGYIWAYSEPGTGTTFKVHLPRTDAESVAGAVKAGGEPPRGRGERILLVEDEASLLMLCETLLSALGYRVSSAGSGLEALLLAAKEGFETDLVVTDVIMPGMSGLNMVERLRQDRPGLRVLYMSGYSDEAIARQGILGPGMFFLEKPFTERALAVEVRKALGGMAEGVRP